ncbi:hypothetical protein BBJ28_00018802 [Nothophytophthora sp. Chile5]|nr:hypothetical protein BBJ28_00018802 [Nothophytophthora sp. Chile5]
MITRIVPSRKLHGKLPTALLDETAEVKERMARLHHRVDILAQVIERQDEGATKLLPSQEETDRVLCVQTISAVFSTSASADHQRPGAITAAYNQCEAIPPLEMKYSHPGFFAEEWLKNETERQQRALELKEERRRERREEHSLRKAHELQQQQRGVVESTGNAAVSEDPEQKLKFLTIRSWREIYGTGEGKELARQQQQLRIGDRIPSLRDLRKKTRQSVSSIGEDPTLVDGSQQPPPPPPSLPTRPDGPTHDRHCSFSTEQSGPSSSAVLQPTVSPRGAFMQEMDDDEITMEMEEPFTNGVPPPPPPPPLPDATRPDEFTDHGLSYYYDPAASLGLVPPPPPPPPPPTELDEPRASETDEYFDAHDPSDDETPPPPPPPPMDEMEPPPPPPPPPPSESWRPSNLLEEIQLGASLRSAQETRRQREAPTETLSPQAALLRQILQKQSRPLRPVESRRPPIQPRTSAAPFADSIARILERRAMIAYDSDSAESSKSSGGDDDW